MTILPVPAPDAAPSTSIDADRLCVAARSVLDHMFDLRAEGLTDVDAEQITEHARALVVLHDLQGLPLAAVRAHVGAVTNALTRVAGDRSLTLAVWFEEGLGTR